MSLNQFVDVTKEVDFVEFLFLLLEILFKGLRSVLSFGFNSNLAGFDVLFDSVLQEEADEGHGDPEWCNEIYPDTVGVELPELGLDS